MRAKIHSVADFAAMRRAGALAAQTLDYISSYVQPGVTTEYLDQLCHNFIVEHGAIPAPLHYRDFPKSICTSVNHVVCHGIPSKQQLKAGDIINIDVTVKLDGWHGDTSRMFVVAETSIKGNRLISVTYQALMLGIAAAKPGATLGDIGYAIQNHATKHNFSIVKEFCGHGIGRQFHDYPDVLHYGQPGKGLKIEPGMFFTIEPMLNAGKAEVVIDQRDGWTVSTKDRSLSAQFEHTIGINESGAEIFTISQNLGHE